MLQKCEYNLDRGFLPATDPLDQLPAGYEAWEQLAAELPKLLVSNELLQTLRDMPVLCTADLYDENILERAMLLLSFLAHAFVWGTKTPSNSLPPSIAIPWYQVATKLHRPPILSYASYALHNWRRFNINHPVELGNITLLQNFLGGIDEEWFVLVHIDIEMKAAKGLQKFLPLQEAVGQNDVAAMTVILEKLITSLLQMCETLDRMTEHCDPYIYFNRVRPYIHGWKDNPSLPNGLIYEGVGAYQGNPQKFRGETGAQSSIIPAFDALFGVVHRADPLRIYLKEMRDYMPRSHKQFLEEVEGRGSIREFVQKQYTKIPFLKDQYNTCLELLSRFRKTHLQFAAHYIQKQSQNSLANPTHTGTGGTPFMQYLKKHKDETLDFLLP